MAVGTRKPKKQEKTTAAAGAERPRKSAGSTGADPTAMLAGIIEAGFLAAMTDGKLADAEFDQLSEVIDHASDGALSTAQIRGILEACRELLDAEGFDKRMAAIAGQLPDRASRETALRVVAAVIFSDEEYDQENEGQFYMDLAGQLDIPKRSLKAIWKETFELFS